MRHSERPQEGTRDTPTNRDTPDTRNVAHAYPAPRTLPQRHPVDEIERALRRAYVAPLFAYCARRDMVIIRIARRAATRAEGVTFSRTRLTHIKRGRAPAPSWFIPEMCREIGEPIEVIMGAEWAQRHPPLPDTADVPATTPATSGDAPAGMDSASHEHDLLGAERRAS